MLSFFPPPYPDELLYSVIGRYHLRSGNSSPKWTFIDLFGTNSMILIPALPSHLKAFSHKTFGSTRIKVEDWIKNHTLFPFFAPFMPTVRANQLKEMMKGPNGSGIHAFVGLSAGGVVSKEFLVFCPVCYEEDIKRFGEPYWHRSHQAPGVFVCNIHNCMLHKITEPVEDRHGIVTLPIANELFESEKYLPAITSERTISKLVSLSLDIANALKANEIRSLYSSKELLLPRLAEKGYVTYTNRIRQAQLQEQFNTFYGEEFLELLESGISQDSSWLNFATRKERRVINPVRYLLLIRFLYGSWNEFIQVYGAKYSPFGDVPWPCLNRAAEHFGRDVVQTLQISRCSDTGKPVGIFSCECGHIYSRRGPDQSIEDRMKIGKVRSYGSIWINKANQCIDKGLSFRQTAKMLGVDVGTVIKYTQSANDAPQNRCYEDPMAKVVKERPIKRRRPRKAANSRVNWTQRDEELSKLVVTKCREMLEISEQKPTRVRFTTIAKKIGKLSLLGNRKGKLPKTMAEINRHIETVEQFQIRRIKWAALKNKGRSPLKKWELIKAAGLRPNYSEALEHEIEKNISQSNYLYVDNEVV
ncbi:TnsD family Tn7-like transposition protein [Paenibacillus tyrfis]|uniref:TnsD family Tn7-like transposition protein n=1 Tax=Paenibacillus tyrfis TaxID=1501230 RepID=UPI0020A1E555|nr:TnsD family Tn7-like transposition protein [Paenibacillus tyrfis]MCP1312594.1 TnsD family transposase [Paenibacillus tyrfis]